MLNWDDLRVALAIGRTGSLTRAASVLDVNQSTATRRLATLEAAVGATLFVRTKAGLTPTDAGATVIARAGEVELRLERMNEQLQNIDGAPTGTVRIRGDGWVLDRLTRTVTAPFLAAHPGLELRMVPQGSGPVLPRGASISLWFERAPREMEFAVKLGAVPFAAYAADGAGTAAGWVHLLDEETPRFAPTRHLDQLRRRGETIRMSASDAQITVAAVVAGIGRGILPVCLAQGYPNLRRLEEGPPDLWCEMSLHLHPDTVQTARVQAVIRWLREVFDPTFLGRDVAAVSFPV